MLGEMFDWKVQALMAGAMAGLYIYYEIKLKRLTKHAHGAFCKE